MNSPALRPTTTGDKRVYPKRAKKPIVSTGGAGRRARGSAGRRGHSSGGGGIVGGFDEFGVPIKSQKWTKVYRNPTAPLDNPYFGSSPMASFKIPMWVRIDELTPEERKKYDEEEKKIEERRAAWKKDLDRAKTEDEPVEEEGAKEDEGAVKGSDEDNKETPIGYGEPQSNNDQIETRLEKNGGDRNKTTESKIDRDGNEEIRVTNDVQVGGSNFLQKEYQVEIKSSEFRDYDSVELTVVQSNENSATNYAPPDFMKSGFNYAKTEEKPHLSMGLKVVGNSAPESTDETSTHPEQVHSHHGYEQWSQVQSIMLQKSQRENDCETESSHPPQPPHKRLRFRLQDDGNEGGQYQSPETSQQQLPMSDDANHFQKTSSTSSDHA